MTILKGSIVMVPYDPQWNSEDDEAVAIVTKVWNADADEPTIGVRVIPDSNQSDWRTVLLLTKKPDSVPGEPMNLGVAWLPDTPKPAAPAPAAPAATPTTTADATAAPETPASGSAPVFTDATSTPDGGK